MNDRRDLVDWAHAWGEDLLRDGEGAGLSPSELVVVMAMAYRFVLSTYPAARDLPGLLRAADTVAGAA